MDRDVEVIVGAFAAVAEGVSVGALGRGRGDAYVSLEPDISSRVRATNNRHLCASYPPPKTKTGSV